MRETKGLIVPLKMKDKLLAIQIGVPSANGHFVPIRIKKRE